MNQAAWNMEKQETKNRELAAIRLAKDVTWDTDDALEDGIKIVPVWKLMLLDGEEYHGAENQ